MNGKIAFVMLISFLVTGSALVLLAILYSDLPMVDQNHSFFKKKFEPDLKKIFMFGSSHAAVLNSTFISNNLSENHPDYDFYNLSYGSDKPKERLVLLPKIIALNPDIVFYGISYRDVASNPD